MKLNQMEAFQEVMLTGTVSEAARNLNRSQPAISALIAGLEQELGMQLFERRQGRLHPVPEAYYLKEECALLLNRLSTVEKNMRDIKTLDSGRIEIASMPGPSVFLMPNLIADFVAEKPGIKSTLIARSSQGVYQLVASQQFDLGIADDFDIDVSGTSLVSASTYQFNCLCAIPAEDPLAERKYITPADLEDKPLATLYSDHETRINTDKVFAQANRRMNVKYVTRFFIPHLTYVERRIAYAIIDPIAMESYRLYRGDAGSIVFRPFKPTVSYLFAVLTPAYRPASLLTKSFTQKFKDKIESLGGIPLN